MKILNAAIQAIKKMPYINNNIENIFFTPKGYLYTIINGQLVPVSVSELKSYLEYYEAIYNLICLFISIGGNSEKITVKYRNIVKFNKVFPQKIKRTFTTEDIFGLKVRPFIDYAIIPAESIEIDETGKPINEFLIAHFRRYYRGYTLEIDDQSVLLK